MKHLEFLNLKFNNIGRFTSEQTLDMSSLDQLNQIDGMNLNTGNSSGAGKSTVIKIVCYLFGVESTPATKLQSRLTKEKGYAIGDFLWKGEELKIKRSMGSTGLEIWGTDPVTKEKFSITGNNKLAEEKLLEIIGTDPKVWAEIIRKKQKSRGYFLKLTAGEKYKLLLNLLGLGPWLTKLETANKKLEVLKKEIESIESYSLKIASTHLEEKKLALSVLTPPSIVGYDLEIQRIEFDLTSHLEDVTRNSLEYNSRISMLVKPTKMESVQDHTRLNQLITNMNTITSQIQVLKVDHSNTANKLEKAWSEESVKLNTLNSKKMAITPKATMARSVMEEIKHLEKNSCPTCLRAWEGEELVKRIAVLREKFAVLKTEIETIQKEIAGIAEVESNLVRLKSILDEHRKQNTWKALEDQWQGVSKEKTLEEQSLNSLNVDQSYLESLNRYNASKREIEIERDALINKINSEISQLKIDLAQNKNDLALQNSLLVRFEADKKLLEAAIVELEAKIVTLTQEKEEKASEILVVEEGIRVIKSFTIQKFKDSLDTIASYANTLLEKVPNTMNSTVYFDAFKIQSNGAIKEEVTCYISLDGEIAVPLDTLCGGEETTFELAIDMGFNEMVESSANIGFSHYFMDEPFDGMDDTCVTEMVEILKGLKTSKKLVILSHAPAIKELAEKTILIERNGDNSYIKNII